MHVKKWSLRLRLGERVYAYSSNEGVTFVPLKNSKWQGLFFKVLNERRRKIYRKKECCARAMRTSVTLGHNCWLQEITERWEQIHNKRYLVTLFEDSFWSMSSNLCHGVNSCFLKYTVSGNRDIFYNLNGLHDEEGYPVVSKNCHETRIVP